MDLPGPQDSSGGISSRSHSNKRNGFPRLVNRLCDRIVREASLVEATTIDGALAESSLVDETSVPAIGRPAVDPISLWLSQVDEVRPAALPLEDARKNSPIESEVSGLRLGLGVDVDRPAPRAGMRRCRRFSSPHRIIRAAERIVAAPFAVPSYLYRTITARGGARR